MSDKIKCPSCGKEIKATAKHCGFCGAKIEAKPVEKPIEKPVENNEENSSAYVNPLEGTIPTRGTRGGANPTTVATEAESEKKENAPVGKVCAVCGRKAARGKFCGVCGGTLIDDTGEDYTKDVPKDIPVVLSGVPARKGTDEFMDVDDLGKEKFTDEKIKKSITTTNIHPDFKPAGDL